MTICVSDLSPIWTQTILWTVNSNQTLLIFGVAELPQLPRQPLRSPGAQISQKSTPLQYHSKPQHTPVCTSDTDSTYLTSIRKAHIKSSQTLPHFYLLKARYFSSLFLTQSIKITLNPLTCYYKDWKSMIKFMESTWLHRKFMPWFLQCDRPECLQD